MVLFQVEAELWKCMARVKAIQNGKGNSKNLAKVRPGQFQGAGALSPNPEPGTLVWSGCGLCMCLCGNWAVLDSTP